MPRTYSRLTAIQVSKLVKQRIPGMYPDGDGLYLAISKTGVASWSFRFMIAGRARVMGLGPLRDVNLSRARQLTYEACQQKRQGVDPLEARREKRLGAAVRKARTVTFETCAKGYVTARQSGWKSAQHRRQWISSLERYVYPVLGPLPVESIDTARVMQVLDEIWQKTPETASRVRGRIEAVIDWAKARGHPIGENPARWRSVLSNWRS